MTSDLQSALITSVTSRANKLWLACDRGVPFRWQGAPRRSRLAFLIDGEWKVAKSFDEDVLPGLVLNSGTRVC